MAKEIKFRETRFGSGFNVSRYHTGVKNGFKFKINTKDEIYATIIHKTKDIRFNTLWAKIKFETLHDCIKWCNDFNYTQNKCLGNDCVFVSKFR